MTPLYSNVSHAMYFCCIAAGVGGAFSHVCLSVCLSVCPHSKRKTASAINTKFGTHT